ncbi:MAG: hypothetical protein QXH21_08915 [Ignisphaera sp.]
MSETKNEIKIEEVVGILRNMEEEMRRSKIEKITSVSKRIANLIACLGDSAVCLAQLECFYDTLIMIEGIGVRVSNDTTIAQLRSIIKDMIVRNADKILRNILSEVRKVLLEIVNSVEEDP